MHNTKHAQRKQTTMNTHHGTIQSSNANDDGDNAEGNTNCSRHANESNTTQKKTTHAKHTQTTKEKAQTTNNTTHNTEHHSMIMEMHEHKRRTNAHYDYYDY